LKQSGERICGALWALRSFRRARPQPLRQCAWRARWSAAAATWLSRDLARGFFLPWRPTNSWDNDALVQPESRAAYAKLLAQGWTDAIRELYPDDRIYTFWHYWRNSWQRNAGLRIDHFLLSPSLAKRLVGAGVDRDMRGLPNASDHAPVWINLKTERARKRRTSSFL